MSNDVITVGGKRFKPVTNSTIEQDFWTASKVEEAGLANLVMNEGENPEQFALRILGQAMKSKNVFLMLGGLMMPDDKEGHEWSPEIATETADFLRKCTDAEDKNIIRRQVVALLLGFMEAGLTFYATSRKSSPKPAGEGVQSGNGG